MSRSGLREIYIQTNIHLVQADKKRDQLLVFYFAIVGIYLTLLTRSSDSYIPYTVDVVAFISMVVLTVIIGWLLILYRKWHTFYLETAKILAEALITKAEKASLGKNWKKMIAGREIFGKGRKYRIDDVMFNGFLVISLPVFIHAMSLIFQIESNETFFVPTLLLFGALYFYLANLVSSKAQATVFSDNWIIQSESKNTKPKAQG